VASGFVASESGVAHFLDMVIRATRVALTLVVAGLVLVVVARLSSRAPLSEPRLTLEYGATFVFVGAWMVVKNGIMETTSTWQRDAWSQTLKVVSGVLAALLLAGIIHVGAGLLAHTWHTDIKHVLLWALVVWFFFLTSTETTGKRKRRRRRR
jgi:uncharacterized membrane protein